MKRFVKGNGFSGRLVAMAFVCTFALVIGLGACSNGGGDRGDGEPTLPSNVSVVGIVYSKYPRQRVATLWNNGEATALSDGTTSAIAYAIAIAE
jgi:hypothetical protein